MSKFSDDLIKQIQDEIDRRGEPPGSLVELNRIASQVANKYNQSGLPEFEGLSPQQMTIILHRPFSPECPVAFVPVTDRRIAASSPLMRTCAIILQAIRDENGVKLTQKGNLPRKIVEGIFRLNIYNDTNTRYRSEKVLNEKDYVPAAYARALLELGGMVNIRNGRMSLTKTGKDADNSDLLYRNLFTAFVLKFNNGYLDGYESDSIGNLGVLYVIYLLNRFGLDKREASFYAELYFKAFPDLLKEITPSPYSDPVKSAYDCFIYRIFDKGLFLFGLVDIEYTGKYYSDGKMVIKPTKILSEVFKVV